MTDLQTIGLTILAIVIVFYPAVIWPKQKRS